MKKIIKQISASELIILTIILLAGFLIRLINLNYNSPFLDEATYIMLGLPAWHGNFEGVSEAIYWVGGSPYVYPLFTSAWYQIGGILGSRFGNVLLGTASVFLLYLFCIELRFFKRNSDNHIAGLISAALFATAAVPIYLSRVAIYDMASYFFFSAGLVCLAMIFHRQKRRTAVLAALLFSASFFAKYITGIYLPFLLLVSLVVIRRKISVQHRLFIGREFIFVLIFTTMMYGLFNFDGLVSFITSNAETSGTTIALILNSFWYPSRIIFFLAVGGAWFLFDSRRYRLLGLYGAAIVPVVAHIFIRNSDAATQSSFLSLVFLVPVAGWLLTELVRFHKKIGLLVVVTLVTVNFFTGREEVQQRETAWPNSTESVTVLQAKISAEDKLLAEGDDIYALALMSDLRPAQVSGPFEFSYGSLTGTEAYVQALSDGYFKYVQLEQTYFSESDYRAIEVRLPDKYLLLWTDGAIRIYERI